MKSMLPSASPMRISRSLMMRPSLKSSFQRKATADGMKSMGKQEQDAPALHPAVTVDQRGERQRDHELDEKRHARQ